MLSTSPSQLEYHFDQSRADRAINFIGALRHTSGEWAGKRFQLTRWQKEEVLTPGFGMIDQYGRRQYRTIFIFVPKKNGKSELGAGVALYLLAGDQEPGAQVVSAAADREQASLVYNVAAEMVHQSPVLSERIKVVDSTKRMIHLKSKSVYKVLSAESRTKHGLNLHGVVFDELHAQPDRRLYDVLTMGSGDARRQQLIFIMTTAGDDVNSIGYEIYEYAKKVKDGIINDPTFLPVLYGADEEANWEDEEVWKQSNPSLGTVIDFEKIRKAYTDAKVQPALQPAFRRLRLNQWRVGSAASWIPIDKWKACRIVLTWEELYGRPCYIGLDLSRSLDPSAATLVFPPQDQNEPFKMLQRIWVPRDTLYDHEIKDKVPYRAWADHGYIKATPGDVQDFDAIYEDLKEMQDSFKVREIVFDRWGARKVVQDLAKMKFTVFEFPQTFALFSPTMKDFEQTVLTQDIGHDGNPAMTWMMDSTAVDLDYAGNIRPNKKKSRGRIDAVVAGLMAYNRAVAKGLNKRYYAERGIAYINLGAA